MVSSALVDSAEADQAAARAGVLIRDLDSADDFLLADRLFTLIWGGERQDAMPTNLMRALAHSGNYVAGAFRGDQLVGASVGFAWGHTPALHSHISGVVPDDQGRGVGYALKLHQRTWAARRGLETITWTFDPLVRRNAWFNLVKLGARIEGYHADFYGPMDDDINAGDPTDRCLVHWPVDAGASRASQAEPVEAILVEGAAGEPIVLGATGAESLGCQIPDDIVELRRRDAGLARQWRLALRQTMGAAIENGYVATSISRDGHYVLTRRST